jgi:hypothetical protein
LAPLTLLAIAALAHAAELAELVILAGILGLGFVVLAARLSLASRARAR